MKYRYLVITLLLAGITSVRAQEATTQRLTAPSDATRINRAAAATTLAYERSRLSNAEERQAFLSNTTVLLEQTKSRLFDAISKKAADKVDALKSIMAEAMLSMHLSHLSDQAEGGIDLAQGKGLSLALTRAEAEVQIHALLGDDSYALYLVYQQSEPYRATIQQLAETMRAQGSAITADQELAMLDAYTAAILTAAADSVKEADPKVSAGLNAAERRALGAVELCGLAPVIAGPQRQRFESYLSGAVSGILNPDDFKRFQKIRSEPTPRPDWRDFVPVQFRRPQ